MDYYKESLKMHEKHKGKMGVVSRVELKNKDDLAKLQPQAQKL